MSNARRFKFETFDSIEESAEPVYLIHGLVEVETFAVLWGAPGSGKTFLSIAMAVAVATACSFGGAQAKKATVLYISAEGERGFRRRIHKIRKALGLGAIPFIVLSSAPNFGAGENDVQRLINDLAEAKIQPEFLIVDTLSRTFGAGNDDSSSAAMALYVANISRLQQSLQTTVLVIHHSGKDESRGMRGSSALQGAADTIFKTEEAKDGHRVVVEKQRDGAKGAWCSFTISEAGLLEMGRWENAGTDGQRRKPAMGKEAALVMRAVIANSKTDKAITDYIECLVKTRAHARNIKSRGLDELLHAGKLVRVGETYDVPV